MNPEYFFDAMVKVAAVDENCYTFLYRIHACIFNMQILMLAESQGFVLCSILV